MGTFSWPIRISDLAGRRSRDLEAIVDTGAAYTTLPTCLLHELGVAPLGARRFLIATGGGVTMEWGEVRATIDGESATTLVVFGEDDAPTLLGAYTPEGLGLAVDPVEQRLVPDHAHPLPGVLIPRPRR